ncbi:uncharacterized protein V6R79_004561 [Siganus canaliculatus]
MQHVDAANGAGGDQKEIRRRSEGDPEEVWRRSGFFRWKRNERRGREKLHVCVSCCWFLPLLLLLLLLWWWLGPLVVHEPSFDWA